MEFSVPEPHCHVLLIPTLACDRQRPHPVTCQEPLNEEPPSCVTGTVNLTGHILAPNVS